MAAEFICDACGKRAPAEFTVTGVFKPRDWFARSPKDGKPVQLHACSRECVAALNRDRDDPMPILPL